MPSSWPTNLPGLSGARNTGVARSTGDVVAFLDDDAYADPGWLAKLIAPMANPAVAGVGGGSPPLGDGTTGMVSGGVLLGARMQLHGSPDDGWAPAESDRSEHGHTAQRLSFRRRFRLRSRKNRKGPTRLRGDRALYPLHRTLPRAGVRPHARRCRASLRARPAAHLALLLDEVLGGGGSPRLQLPPWWDLLRALPPSGTTWHGRCPGHSCRASEHCLATLVLHRHGPP